MSASPRISRAIRPGQPPPRRQRLDSFKNPQPRPPPSLKQNNPANQPSNARECPNPECLDKDVGEEDGQIICRGCGTVISESNIVSDVQFAETASGGHLMIGQHVGADQAFARGSLAGLRNAGGMTGREITEANGKRYINQIGAALNMGERLTGAGLQVFKLAASLNFIQGRTTSTVAAVSLYIACRAAKGSTHMLIDFADILQVNVFRLGQVYKDLLKEIGLNGTGFVVEPISPEGILERFADRLEFGNDRIAVANDGVRILQRMDRDWMTPGRRPAGVCAAALIIAARMHNYRRTVREMVFVAKVAAATIDKRLEEFKRTASSRLTIEEFRTIDLERFEDPPAFSEKDSQAKSKTRKRKYRDVDDDGDTEIDSRRATPAAPSSSLNVQAQTSGSSPQQTQDDRQSMPPPPKPIDTSLAPREPPSKRRRGRPRKAKLPVKQGQPLASPAPSQELPLDPNITTAMADPSSVAHAAALTQVLDTDAAAASPPATQHDAALTTRPPIRMTEEISDSEFDADSDLLNWKLSTEEIKVKTRIWTHDNRDWIRAQSAKLLKQQLAEANGTVPQVKRRTRHRTRMGDMASYRRESLGDAESAEGGAISGDEDSMPARDAAEATMKMMKKRGYSKKINYDIVRKTYQPSSKASSTSGSRRESVSGASVIAQSPGAGDLFERPSTPGSIEATKSGSTARAEGAEAVASNEIQELAREEKEERSMTGLGAGTRNLDPLEEEEEEDHPDDYIDEDEEAQEGAQEEDGGDEELEDILMEARKRAEEEEEDNMESDEDYD
ncbi:MAG: hypothetical protein Q9191_001612 [Dirinaria sp. TL-2023a]